ncbi:CAZyme family CE10 [Penicillium lividum]|nr:CAZyme family CE10 [Penicillium lividum]
MNLLVSLRSTLFTILIYTTACLKAYLQSDNPVVDLGYAQYQGYYNSTSSLNIFLGTNMVASSAASYYEPDHYHSYNSSAATLSLVPKVYGFNSDLGNEDYLYLNVFAPPNAQDLPVLIWIRKLMPLYIFFRPTCTEI